MIVRHPKAASKAVVCICKVIDLPSGVDDSRYGTGFLYADEGGQVYLVSNWHVFTGRRPDEPSHLLGDAAQSPRAVLIGLQEKGGPAHRVREFPLYKSGAPLWRQHQMGPLFDIAALPISIPDGFEVTTIQQAAVPQQGAIEPGFDLIVIGFPFVAGDDIPYPFWKRALLASEPSVQMFGNPQMLIDTAGTPGMSGSPVFVSHVAYIDSPQTLEARRRVEAGESHFFDEPDFMGLGRETQTVGLEWVGIYAGATGSSSLDRLQLGRMYAASAVEEVIKNVAPGYNPFPPLSYG